MQRENTHMNAHTPTHTYADAHRQKTHTAVFVSVDKTVLRDCERRGRRRRRRTGGEEREREREMNTEIRERERWREAEG